MSSSSMFWCFLAVAEGYDPAEKRCHISIPLIHRLELLSPVPSRLRLVCVTFGRPEG